MFRFRSLNERLSVFMLFPVALLLIAMGYAGFIYARDSMLTQWRESTILMLQQTAHRIDMRLSIPKEWIKMFYRTSGKNFVDHHVQQWIINQLQNLEGVDKVELMWLSGPADVLPQNIDRQRQVQPKGKGRQMSGTRMHEAAPMPFHGGHITKITAPRYNSARKHETISLISDLLDRGGRKMGQLEVRVRTDYLFEDIEESGFWQSTRAYLVDAYGRVIQSTTGEEQKKLFHPEDPFGLRTMYAMRSLNYGTVFGSGNPPARVSGFYQLEEAPWSLVMIYPVLPL
jgi:sigma-B regulation protein RsbU (phosphoserine phosphatase)